MCTLSVFCGENSLKITMNRDERLDRAGEIAPYVWDAGFMAPRDVQSGGTWIGMHPETRRWACLLNGYAEGDAAPKVNMRSRGGIVPAFLRMGFEAFIAQLEVDQDEYASFRLVCGDGGVMREVIWDGAVLLHAVIECEDGWLFRSSSSWQQERVVAHRENIFHAWKSAPHYNCAIDIPSFHSVCEVGDEASSILMQRDNPERATTSITMIDIDAAGVLMHYVFPQEQSKDCLSALQDMDISDFNIKTIRHV